MKHFSVLSIFVSLIWCTFSVNAASLIPAQMGGQVQQTLEAGKVNGCGLTLFGVEQAQSGRVLVFNGSIVVFNSGAALIKGRVSSVDQKVIVSSGFSPKDLTTLRSKNLWMKAPRTNATTPTGSGILDSEDKGYVLYAASLDTAFPVVLSVLEGEKIQIGFHTDGNKSAQIMFGEVSLTGDEKEQLRNCLQEIRR